MKRTGATAGAVLLRLPLLHSNYITRAATVPEDHDPMRTKL
jgi:hypothetical protein